MTKKKKRAIVTIIAAVVVFIVCYAVFTFDTVEAVSTITPADSQTVLIHRMKSGKEFTVIVREFVQPLKTGGVNVRLTVGTHDSRYFRLKNIRASLDLSRDYLSEAIRFGDTSGQPGFRTGYDEPDVRRDVRFNFINGFSIDCSGDHFIDLEFDVVGEMTVPPVLNIEYDIVGDDYFTFLNMIPDRSASIELGMWTDISAPEA